MHIPPLCLQSLDQGLVAGVQGALAIRQTDNVDRSSYPVSVPLLAQG